MAVTINGKLLAVATPPKKNKSGHTQPKKPLISLNEPGRLRTAHFQYLLGGLSHSAFHARGKRGLVPKPDGYDPRPYWKTETVLKYLEG